jgi:hypothetical protein
VSNAGQKIRSLHTAELRVAQILRWLENGIEPDFSRQESA